MFRIKNLFSLLLFIFSVIITSLFFYLYTIENNMKNYNSYKSDLNELASLTIHFNNFLDKKDKFVNFDEIVKKTNRFNEIIKSLKESNLDSEFGNEAMEKLSNLQDTYLQKKELLERFKSRQAANLNSIHYIYDLNQYFSTFDGVSSKTKLTINHTLFMIMQYFTELNENKKGINTNLEYLKIQSEKYNLKKLELLYWHSKKILENIEYFKLVKKKSADLNINSKLEDINRLLETKYKNELFNQLLISSFFFFSVIVVIIMIYKEHKKSIKIRKELSAFKYAVENSDNSVVLTDPQRNILYVNDIFEKNTGFQKTEVQGHKPKMLSSGETPQEVYSELNEKLEAGKKWEGEFINRKKDGTLFYEKASIVPIIMDDEVVNYLAIKLDITKYIKQKEDLVLSSIAFKNVQEGILICDDNKKIITINKAFEEITGYSKKDVIGRKPNTLKSGFHDRLFYKQMWSEIRNKGHWKGKVYDKRKDGQVIPLWLNISAIKDKNGQISKYIAVHTNLKEIIETQEKADFLAYHDPLTELPNRVKLEEDLNYSLSLANRNNINIFVLFIDLDRFKIINDTLGHDVGDELLKIISQRIKNVLRETDIIARMGGDEFVVVLDSSRDKKSAGYVCEKILEVMKDAVVLKNHTLTTSASIGVAIYPTDGKDFTSLIKNADTAMYYAKKQGKDNYQYYDEQLSIAVHEQLEIEQALKDALKENQLYLNYQPQYIIDTKEVISFEALVRWQHQKLGFVRPDKFISIAEDTGMIIDIGRFIFDMACRDFVEFKKINKNLKYIAINISSVQFKDKNFLEDVKTIIEKYDLKPEEVELEVTERYIMEFSNDNMSTLNSLRNLGFRFSIDDFGTGYSSMSYLTKLPIDMIKVDKSFIDGTPQNHSNVQISKAIVALSKSLGYEVIAEGIEYEEQEGYLNSIECNLGQGFLFSKPLGFDDVVSFLKN